jgi:hypothetical protein
LDSTARIADRKVCNNEETKEKEDFCGKKIVERRNIGRSFGRVKKLGGKKLYEEKRRLERGRLASITQACPCDLSDRPGDLKDAYTLSSNKHSAQAMRNGALVSFVEHHSRFDLLCGWLILTAIT